MRVNRKLSTLELEKMYEKQLGELISYLHREMVKTSMAIWTLRLCKINHFNNKIIIIQSLVFGKLFGNNKMIGILLCFLIQKRD